MALLPSNQRDQIMVIVCVAALGLAGVYYQYLWSPKNDTLALLQTRVDSLIASNEIARREMARGNAGRLREEADEYGRMLVQMRQLVPTANEVPALIDNISTAARRVGLDLGPMEPMGVVTGDVFNTHKWKMSVTGPYHRVAEFLTNVGNLTRIVAPMNVTLTPTTRQAVKARPGEQLLDANFEIQTYVAKVGVPATSENGTKAP
ncbi:MAG TPA: type 4a pilus biogenesis protein PilO [Gemmatimonadaceae bacterium]|nr:type 4a pilus biogenesis protein PilO [Gemmatimonadaceae bacterium]